MIGRCLLVMLVAVVLAQTPGETPSPAASGPAAAETQPGEQVGPRYTAALHGFSICPPRGVQRVHEPSARRLVCWVRRDEKTAAIRWSLEVRRNRHPPTDLPAAEYAKLVAGELARKEHFKVNNIEVIIVAGRPAMDFRGAWSAAMQLWRRQIWVPLGWEESPVPDAAVQTDDKDKPQEGPVPDAAGQTDDKDKPKGHLVLDIAGRMEDKDEMEAALTASVRTLRLFDPSAAIAERSRNIARGAEVLKGIDADKLRRVLVDKTQYFLVEMKGRTVGFLEATEGMAQRDGARGLSVVRRGVLKLPARPRQLMHEDLFATADRSIEMWRTVTLAGEGPSAVGPIVHEGLKQQELLLAHTSCPGRPRRSRKLRLPGALGPVYLPAALAVVLPRMLDTSTPAGYGLAVFNIDAADFHMRTVRVVGPEKITLDDKTITAVHLTDQMSQDAPPVDLWVDQNGLLLRMCTGEGLSTRRSDRQAVVAAFADELAELKKLERN